MLYFFLIFNISYYCDDFWDFREFVRADKNTTKLYKSWWSHEMRIIAYIMYSSVRYASIFILMFKDDVDSIYVFSRF